MFSKHLQLLRKENNLTQEQLSKDLGLSRHAIVKYENNQRQPDFDTLIKIATYFNVSIDWLLGMSDSRKLKHPSENQIYKTIFTGVEKIVVDVLGKTMEDKEAVYKAFDILLSSSKENK